jgi:hypothetical protein
MAEVGRLADSTQMSLLPPPRCVETMSSAVSDAMRAMPPGRML